MDSNFTFPRPQAAVPRPALAQEPTGPSKTISRESNALRASVLNAALELGIGSNPLVADWMFNNALAEEDEEEDQASSPGLTYGSSATSEESSFSALTPSSSTHSSSSGAGANAKSFVLRNDGMIGLSESETTGSNLGNTVSFPEMSFPSRPTTPGGTRKLKKKPRDGYESDGGYMSEAGKKKDKKKADSKDGQHVFPTVETDKEAKKRAKEEKKELMEEERKKKKSLLSAVKASKKAEKEAEQSKGYDTDGGGGKSLGKSKSKKSKSKSAFGDGYETDGAGYQSSTPTPGVKKSKTRFFKLSTKGSRDIPAEPVPAMPPQIPKEVIPLPIAERFATTLSPTTPSQASSALSSTTSLPSSKTDNSSTPLPPLAFQPFAPAPPSSSEPAPSSRIIATSPAPTDRTSHASSDSTSSTSSNPKRRGVHFSPSREGSSNGHGSGSGSYSTLTSQSHQNHPSSPTNADPSSSLQHGPSASSGSLKLPTISYPITRSPSPISPSIPTTPIAPLNIKKGLRIQPSLENMTSSRNPSPLPISPTSPYATSPRSPSPSTRPKNPPNDGFGSRPPAPQPGQQTLSPNSFLSPTNAVAGNGKFQKPTHLSIIPSTDYIVPSRSPSPRPAGLTSPNVLAYYDIPPPSPPPVGPLPSVPGAPPGNSGSNSSSNNSNPGQFPSAAVLRQRVIDRTPRQLPPEQVAALQHIQRGKESPFPARPVMPAGSMPTPMPHPMPGHEGRVAAKRYQDLYPQEEKEKPKDTRRARFASELRWIDDERVYEHDGEDDDAGQELRGVLDRFEDRSSESVDSHSGRALERSHSFEALKGKHESFAVSSYRGPRVRDSEYAFDDDGTIGNRNSRWSGSIYSRNSILDEDTSGLRRERLVKGVEEMLEVEKGGVGMGMGRGFIPPVPKLPEAYANMGVHSEVTSPGRSWNKF